MPVQVRGYSREGGKELVRGYTRGGVQQLASGATPKEAVVNTAKEQILNAAIAAIPPQYRIPAEIGKNIVDAGKKLNPAANLATISSQTLKAAPSHLSSESLAAAVYQTDLNNMQLPAGYQVAERIADSRTGLAMMVFTSPKGKPVIAFRGTEGATDVRDVLSDVDPRGIGFGQFEANKQSLAAIAAKYPGATVTGHSLGGALAQRYAAEFNNAGEVITYNAPGVDTSTAAKFKKGKAKVTHYVSNGDPVSLGGEKFIDGEAKIISYKSGKIPVIGNTLDKHMAAVTGGLLGMKDAQVQTITAAELSNPNFKYGGMRATGFTDRRAVENRRKLVGVVATPLNPVVGLAGMVLGKFGIGNK